MAMKIVGIGTAVPEFYMAQADVAEINKLFCCGNDHRLHLISGLYRRAGVRTRYSVVLQAAQGEPLGRQSLYSKAKHEGDGGPTTRERMEVYEREAPRLVVCAARRAVEDSGVDPGSLTHLITVSCTGFHSPGIDAVLIEELGLRRTIERTHVGFMGCHGALNGMRVAASFTRADPQARALLCAVELCTLHFFYGWDAEKIVANSLFADGAGALVGVAAGGSGDAWTVAANGTFLMPDSEGAMSWTIGDHGFRMTLSAQVPELIRQNLAGWLTAWLGEHDVRMDEVATWAVQPGGPRILTAFAEAMGLDNGVVDISRAVLAEYGNMSSATLLFILERLRSSDAPRPCVAVGFGPGMVVETALLR